MQTSWTWFSSKQINAPPGVLKVGTLTGRRWLVVHSDGSSRDFRQLDDSGYGEQMVTAIEYVAEGVERQVTGLDPDLQAVIRAARLFAEQALARRRAELNRTAAAGERPKTPTRSIRGRLETTRSRYR
jgi:hypothetical protein